MEEWTLAVLLLWLFQRTRKPIALLPFGFLPGTPQFAELLRDCTDPAVAAKFRQLEGLRPKAVRGEVGSASRLINAVFLSDEFLARARGGFDLGGFLQKGGKLVVERGEEIDEDAMRTIMGALVLMVIRHASRTADGEYRWVGEHRELRPVAELPVANIGWTRERTKKVLTRIEAVDSRDRMVRRARGWIACVEGAVSGQRGHAKTFRVACKLTHPPPDGFGLTIEQAWPLIKEWNSQCEPPWSDAELLHKLQDAAKRRK